MKYDLSGGVSRSAGRVFKAFRAALFELLQRQSFESISVQTLCNAANYPRSTFYNYFEDIYDLLDFCLQTPIHGFEGEKYWSLPAPQRVYAVFSDLYDLLAEYREAFIHVFQVNRPNGVLRNSMIRRLHQEVFTALTNAVPDNEAVIPQEMLTEHCCNVLNLLLSWCFYRSEVISKEAATTAMRYLLGGLYSSVPPVGGAAT